jgi:uncharacterized protein YicC (UPF0701 family)
LRSLNFKYLEIAIYNLPSTKIILEEKIKREIKKTIHRGKIEIFFFLRGLLEGEVFINEKLLARCLRRTEELAKEYNFNFQFDISNFLTLPRAFSWKEKSIKDEFILSSVKEGLNKLVRFKEKEGKVIKEEMSKNLERLKENIKKVNKYKPRITQDNNKEDIDEEIALISFYINRLEKKLQSSKVITRGKYIDFLTQEILRELNASASKVRNKQAASLIVEAKNYLDRIREQAQNIE